MKPIYLDYNATTPVLPEVVQAMQPYLTELYGNPSSTHWYGRQTRKAIEESRGRVAGLLNCHTDEIIFTSGGSESNNYAIKGIARAGRRSSRGKADASEHHYGEGFRSALEAVAEALGITLDEGRDRR